MIDKIILQFDGACWPNPGGVCSYGWTLQWPDRRVMLGGGSLPVRGTEIAQGVRTNNVAEWAGLTYGLAALRFWGVREECPVFIYGDSQLVIHQLTGRWKCKKDHLKPMLEVCLRLLNEIELPYEAIWKPRMHNKTCDRLAAQAYRMTTMRTLPPL